MPNALQKLLKRLRNKLISPTVAALCDSLKEDDDTWLWCEGGDDIVCSLKHASERFYISILECGSVTVRSLTTDHPPVSLTLAENLILAGYAKSWVTNYNKYVLNIMSSVLKDWKQV